MTKMNNNTALYSDTLIPPSFWFSSVFLNKAFSAKLAVACRKIYFQTDTLFCGKRKQTRMSGKLIWKKANAASVLHVYMQGLMSNRGQKHKPVTNQVMGRGRKLKENDKWRNEGWQSLGDSAAHTQVWSLGRERAVIQDTWFFFGHCTLDWKLKYASAAGFLSTTW